MKRSLTTLAWLVAAAMALTTPAMAQDDANRAAARRLGKEALGLYEQGDYEAALDRFRRAHELVGLTTTGLYTARTLEKLGRLVEASELYLEASRQQLAADAPEQHVTAKADARKAYEALQPRIPQLTIEVAGVPEGTSADVSVDGAPLPPALLGVPRPTDPGDHVVQASIGATKRSQRIALAEGARETVTLDMAGMATPPGTVAPVPVPPDSPSPPSGSSGDPGSSDTGSSSIMSTLGWVAIGVGGAGLIAGAITGGLAISKKSELDDNCPGGECQPEFHDDVDSFETVRLVSSIGLIAGGVLAAGGLVLVLTAPTEDGTGTALELHLQPTGLGVSGRF